MDFTVSSKEVVFGVLGLLFGGILIHTINQNQDLETELAALKAIEPLIKDTIQSTSYSKAQSEAALEQAFNASELANDALRDARNAQSEATRINNAMASSPQLEKLVNSIDELREELTLIAEESAREAALEVSTVLIIDQGIEETTENTIVKKITLDRDAIIAVNSSGSASREATNVSNAGVRLHLSIAGLTCGSNMSFEGESVNIGFFTATSCVRFLKGGSTYDVVVRREDVSAVNKNKTLRMDYLLIAARE